MKQRSDVKSLFLKQNITIFIDIYICEFKRKKCENYGKKSVNSCKKYCFFILLNQESRR